MRPDGSTAAAPKSTGDLAFSFRPTKGGDVTILRDGRAVTVLRGEPARRFLAKVRDATFEQQQQLMARLTGNYKRGNERVAGNHSRRAGKHDA